MNINSYTVLLLHLCLHVQMNSDAHAHKLEDNLAEANARLAEMERNQTELNTTKIHLTGRNTHKLTHG